MKLGNGSKFSWNLVCREFGGDKSVTKIIFLKNYWKNNEQNSVIQVLQSYTYKMSRKEHGKKFVYSGLGKYHFSKKIR